MRVQAYVYLGWSPILAVVTDGSRRVLQVTGWEGGTGTAPATGLYVGATGYEALIANGVDIRGSAGISGTDTLVFGETPTGTINGTNDTFTSAFNFVSGSVSLYVNGIREQYYTTPSANTIVIDEPPLTGYSVQIDYIKT